MVVFGTTCYAVVIAFWVKVLKYTCEGEGMRYLTRHSSCPQVKKKAEVRVVWIWSSIAREVVERRRKAGLHKISPALMIISVSKKIMRIIQEAPILLLPILLDLLLWKSSLSSVNSCQFFFVVCDLHSDFTTKFPVRFMNLCPCSPHSRQMVSSHQSHIPFFN